MREKVDANKYVEVESACQDIDCTSTIIKRKEKGKKKRREGGKEGARKEGVKKKGRDRSGYKTLE